MYPINKTDLDVLRFAHFLALAAITVRFLPKDWPGLKSPWLRPLILCGQHSLEIFCLGVFLAFAGHFVLAEISGGAVMHFLVSLSGILIMSAAAWLFSWYKHVCRQGRIAKNGAAATPIWREGVHEGQLGGHPGPDRCCAGLLAAARRARRGCRGPAELRRAGLPADHREPAAQGRRRR